MSSTSVKTRVRSGRWRKLFRGVYAIAGSAQTRHQRILAACLAAGPDAVAASYTAAELFRLPRIFRRDLPIVAASLANKVRCPKRKTDALAERRRSQKGRVGQKLARPAFTLRHRRYLGRPDARSVCDDIPVANVAWTYLELAAEVPEKELELSIAEARRRGLLTLEELAEVVAQAPERRPAAVLRRILARPVVGQAHRSIGEVIVQQKLMEEGYGDVVMNKPVYAAGRYVGSPDASSERARLIVEVDGPSHLRAEQQSIDRIQTAMYEAMAWAVARVKANEVGSRNTLRARIAAAEKRRRAQPLPRGELIALWNRLTAGLPATHIPSQRDFPTAYAQYL